jgi:hypothetical protein
MEYKSNGYHLDFLILITLSISSKSSHINNPITEFWLKESRSFNLFGFPIFLKMSLLDEDDEPT